MGEASSLVSLPGFDLAQTGDASKVDLSQIRTPTKFENTPVK
jgi:hypothetical protein